ncbi:TonB-dependent receptor [Sphingobacterium faecale]|uniref:TonB-dependent receptor n=1 Tax=Sphingobacterium faecale TaxID=2803775 RepID=A0ABS1R9H6_9SPHI|nr:TonB-dependent receptor [Sphingobacterium faecale]MBL1411194.1 TonB-dependent receptor [Sphingobacterium faecale]
MAILLHVQASTYGQKVSLNFKNASLSDVLDEIQKQTGYDFLYNSALIDGQHTITIRTKNTDVSKVLSQVLAAQGLDFEVDNKSVLIKRSKRMLAIEAQQLESGKRENQRRVITGKVRSIAGNVLTGATVTVKGSPVGTSTDSEGTYSITLDKDHKVLVFTSVGYDSQEVVVGNQSVINVVLQEQVDDLDEVVVVGYRTVKKELVNGAVSTIQMADKEKQTITHASQALYGTNGIHVNQGGAPPGRDGTTIRIRGVNTLGNSNPLVLLDGIEYNLGEIDPADIETITVLKDASAAIYGSRASNGVILVTSKQGKVGKTKIELRSHGGMQQATYLPDVVDDPILYMQMRNRAEANSGKMALTYSQDQIDEYREGLLTDPSVYPATNWFDVVLENGWMQQHNARATGGNDIYNFTIGGGYMKQKGVFIANDDANRYSFDIKVAVQATPRLKINAGMLGNLREFNANIGSLLNSLMRSLPIFSDYHRNGYYGGSWLYTPGRNNLENPRMLVEQGATYRDYQETLTNINLEYKLPFNITYHNTLGYRRNDHFSKDFVPEMYYVDPKTGYTKTFNTSVPSVKDWDSLLKQFTFSQRLVYDQEFENHHFHVMLGQDYQVNKAIGFQAYNWGFYDNSLRELNALSDQTNAQATGSSSLDKLASVYSRLAYDYKQKYIVEGSVRYDGSSRFAPGNQWSFFPSMSVGWILSKEKFFAVPQIDQLKLRASIGKLGNQAVSIGAYNSTVNISNAYNYTFGGDVFGGAAITALTDRDIRWESTLSYNGGFDMSLLGKLSVTADYFYKRTYDILRAISIPGQIGGLSGPTVNLGKVDNKGWEIGLNFNDQRGDFSYALNSSVSYVKNKVVDIAGQQSISGRYIIKEGYPINSYYLYEADGYYQSQEEIDNAKAVYGTRAKLRPGYIKYKNHTDDNYIDDEDKIITGSSIPDYTYSFGTRLGYKNFVLDAQFQGVANIDVYPGGNVALPFNNGANVTYEWARDSWTPNNPNAKLPLLTTVTDAGENFINSTFWLQDASYLRMKNISLTFNMPEKWLKRWGASKMGVYLSGQNLWTLSKFKMMDPEMTTTLANLNEYPNLKSYSLGLNLTF